MAVSCLKTIIGVIAISLLTIFKANAQFYDSDTEVRIYVNSESLNDPAHHPAYVKVFNFNGVKAAELSVSGEKILEDENYLEKNVYNDNNRIITFHEQGSNYDRTRYRHAYTYNRGYVTGGSLWGDWVTDYENYDFSSDGKTLVWNGRKYTRISKEKYIEMLLIIKNKSSQKWR